MQVIFLPMENWVMGNWECICVGTCLSIAKVKHTFPLLLSSFFLFAQITHVLFPDYNSKHSKSVLFNPKIHQITSKSILIAFPINRLRFVDQNSNNSLFCTCSLCSRILQPATFKIHCKTYFPTRNRRSFLLFCEILTLESSHNQNPTQFLL